MNQEPDPKPEETKPQAAKAQPPPGGAGELDDADLDKVSGGVASKPKLVRNPIVRRPPGTGSGES